MYQSKRVRRVRRRVRTGVVHVDGENIDRVHGAMLRAGGLVPVPGHRPSWGAVRHHLARCTDASMQGCFWLPDYPGADTPERDGFLRHLDRDLKFEVRLVDIPSAAGYARDEGVDEAIEAEVHRMLEAPDCPDLVGVATCDGGFLEVLEAVERAGRTPVLVTLRSRCAARLLRTAESRGWAALDLCADLRAWEARPLAAEVVPLHRAEARAQARDAAARRPMPRGVHRAFASLARRPAGHTLGARARLSLAPRKARDGHDAAGSLHAHPGALPAPPRRR